MYSRCFKPLIDIALSLIGLIILSPVLLMISVLLASVNDWKPFFFQSRPGKNGKIFQIVKFKTMNDRRDMDGNLLSDAERLTPIGRFVRKASLDEIPQLINVLKGDMSLVGPRPLLVKYLPLYCKCKWKARFPRFSQLSFPRVDYKSTINFSSGSVFKYSD